jgi:hypothetical protein
MITKTQKQAFIDAIAPKARDGHKLYGVWASVTIAQAIMESTWGTSNIANKANNVFGIKDNDGDSGYPVYSTTSGEFETDGSYHYQPSKFIKFPNIGDGIPYHSKILCSRWATEFRNAKNYTDACYALLPIIDRNGKVIRSGYATDPKYAKGLIRYIKNYKLWQYDCPLDEVQIFKVMSRGSKGDNVKWLQGTLKALGQRITVDGSYGGATKKQVRRYQYDNDLVADGIAGYSTQKALNESEVEVVELEQFVMTGTKNFTVKSFNPKGYKGDDNKQRNGQHFLELLQGFRTWLDKPICFSKTKNGGVAVGGHSGSSMHYIWIAGDIYVKGMTTKQLALKLLEYYEPDFYNSLKSGEFPSESALKQLGIGLGGSSIVHIDFGHWAKENGYPNYGNKRPAYWFYNSYKKLKDWYKRSR